MQSHDIAHLIHGRDSRCPRRCRATWPKRATARAREVNPTTTVLASPDPELSPPPNWADFHSKVRKFNKSFIRQTTILPFLLYQLHMDPSQEKYGWAEIPFGIYGADADATQAQRRILGDIPHFSDCVSRPQNVVEHPDDGEQSEQRRAISSTVDKQLDWLFCSLWRPRFGKKWEMRGNQIEFFDMFYTSYANSKAFLEANIPAQSQHRTHQRTYNQSRTGRNYRRRFWYGISADPPGLRRGRIFRRSTEAHHLLGSAINTSKTNQKYPQNSTAEHATDTEAKRKHTKPDNCSISTEAQMIAAAAVLDPNVPKFHFCWHLISVYYRLVSLDESYTIWEKSVSCWAWTNFFFKMVACWNLKSGNMMEMGRKFAQGSSRCCYLECWSDRE